MFASLVDSQTPSYDRVAFVMTMLAGHTVRAMRSPNDGHNETRGETVVVESAMLAVRKTGRALDSMGRLMDIEVDNRLPVADA